MLMDEINAISEQPTSAPLAPTPNMVSGPVSYFPDISRGPAGVVLMGGTLMHILLSMPSSDVPLGSKEPTQ